MKAVEKTVGCYNETTILEPDIWKPNQKIK
jgi:hypothetical protein